MSSLSAVVAAAAARSAIGGGSIVHRLDFDLGLHRLAAAADGGFSGDYIFKLSITLLEKTFS